jgi:hypothetical protein
MYIIKLDLQDMGTLYFTGRKKMIQGEEQPGLSAELEEALILDSEEEASDMCRKLIELFEMDFYYSFIK